MQTDLTTNGADSGASGSGSSSGSGVNAGDIVTTTVGGFQAVTVMNFTPTTNQYNAVCASRTYVWGGDNSTASSGAGSATSGTGSTSGSDTSSGSTSGTGSTGATGSATSTAGMGGNVIVTMYQTSGTCDQTTMQQFVTTFLRGMTAGDTGSGAGTGMDASGSSSTTSGSTGSGTTGGTGTTTP